MGEKGTGWERDRVREGWRIDDGWLVGAKIKDQQGLRA